jgi:hypothetical protein
LRQRLLSSHSRSSLKTRFAAVLTAVLRRFGSIAACGLAKPQAAGKPNTGSTDYEHALDGLALASSGIRVEFWI